MNVTVYTTPTCGWCAKTKQYLSQRGVPFREVDVSRDRAAAEEMVRRSGQMGVPVITVGDQVVVGFDVKRLESLLRTAGRPRASAGLSIADAMPKTGETGAYVGRVTPSSPGERAGIQPGDVIVEFGRRPVASASDLEQALAAISQGARVTAVVSRAGRRIGLEMHFE